VPLIKIEAQLNKTTDNYQGMLLTNPGMFLHSRTISLLIIVGGPGESGVNWILQHGYADLFSVIPKTYDLVSWEPRGLGYSIPAADCQLPSSAKSKRAYGISGPDVTSAFYTDIFQSAAQLGAQCHATIGGSNGAGPHMSTPVVARDIISILDAYAQTDEGKSVGSPADLNYWGFSYGTVLGQTFASTYPDRVGRFAMDGVVDADDYYAQGLFSTSYYSDAIVDLFFEYCFQAGPALCPFSTGISSQSIKTRFLSLFSKFDVTKAYSEKWENATTLDNALGTMLTTLRVMTYTPVTGFPQMAQTLVAYENTLSNLTLENIQSASQVAVPETTDSPGVSVDLQEWTPAVFCSEASILHNKTIADLAESNEMLRNQSYVAHVGWTSLKILCTGWAIDGKWQFTGIPSSPQSFQTTG
jgi:pimeloyl-ACP methyl ester carboxylesterase